MLWDYIGTLPTIIAIINSVIAVAVSHFKPEQTRWKVALLISAIVLGSVAAVATIVGQQHALAAQAEKVARVVEIREELGEQIQRGNLVLATLMDQKNQTAVEEANAWVNGVEAYLRSARGESYVIRFRDENGLMYMTPLIVSAPDRLSIYVVISRRIQRLQQFISELDTGKD